MRPDIQLAAVKKDRPRDWLIRFAFGGVVSVGAALVSHAWGPSVGGLFLAFPAILPATLTLAKQQSGRQRALEDARGGTLGALALVAFAGTVTWLLPLLPAPAVLAIAAVVWGAVAAGLWSAVFS